MVKSLRLNERKYIIMICLKYLLILFSLYMCCLGPVLHAQVITNQDGSPLSLRYCYTDHNYALAGQPAGGTFSGCGVFQQNGVWYFNPVSSTAGVTVFPYQCALNYTVNGSIVSKNVLIWKPVTIYPPLEDSNTCNGYIALHASTLYAGNYHYKWSPYLYLDHPDSSNTTGKIPGTQEFIITATDVTSGCIGRDTVVLTLSPAPSLTISHDTIIMARQQIKLYASGAAIYNWYPMKWLDTYTGDAVLAAPQAPITYTVVGSSEYGCSDTATVFVDIHDDIAIPNAFSPNDDGLNDVFQIYNYGYQKIQEFRIFNRWGQLVFQTMDGTKGWDGTQNGVPVTVGNYYYQIRLQSDEKDVALYKGEVLLLR